jgi:hypothetical protein
MTAERAPGRRRLLPLLAVALLVTVIVACSVYANLSFLVTDRASLRYFPPFRAQFDANWNRALGGEYMNIAQAMASGQGYSHPFSQPTGPTAWQPPVLPALLAALLRACGGNRDRVVAVVVCLQVLTLIATGLLILALLRQTTTRVGAFAGVAVFLAALLGQFHWWFQYTHDCWIVLLCLDLLIAGLCWARPLGSWYAAAGWGLFGGLCALTSPVVGFTWVVLSLLAGLRQRGFARLGLAGLVAALTLAPWTARNLLLFGRVIPLKSNLAFELYQTQCLQEGGLLRAGTFRAHPYHGTTQEHQEYRELGEASYLQRKEQQFWRAVWADPQDFLDRVAVRCLGVTLWHVPFWPDEARTPGLLWLYRLTHPLPFLALLVLVVTGVREPLHPAQWAVIGVYLLYLLPYIAVSYYPRYGVPLVGVKVLLVLWAAERVLVACCRPARHLPPGR